MITNTSKDTHRLEEDIDDIDDSVGVDWFSYQRCLADIPETEAELDQVLTSDRSAYRAAYNHRKDGDRDSWYTPQVEHDRNPSIITYVQKRKEITNEREKEEEKRFKHHALVRDIPIDLDQDGDIDNDDSNQNEVSDDFDGIYKRGEVWFYAVSPEEEESARRAEEEMMEMDFHAQEMEGMEIW